MAKQTTEKVSVHLIGRNDCVDVDRILVTWGSDDTGFLKVVVLTHYMSNNG